MKKINGSICLGAVVGYFVGKNVSDNVLTLIRRRKYVELIKDIMSDEMVCYSKLTKHGSYRFHTGKGLRNEFKRVLKYNGCYIPNDKNIETLFEIATNEFEDELRNAAY